MTQGEFESRFISKTKLTLMLGKSINFLNKPIEKGLVPKPLEVSLVGGKKFYLYEQSIFENEFIKCKMGENKLLTL